MDFNAYIQQYLTSGSGALNNAQAQSETALQQSLANQKNTLQQTLTNQSSSAREQTEAIKKNLADALNRHKSNVAQNQVETKAQYRDQKMGASTDHALEQKRLREVMAQQGIGGGDSAQSLLMGNIGRQNVLGGLTRQENSVYDQLARALEGYQSQYATDAGYADNELARLLRDYQNNFNVQSGQYQNNYELERSQLVNQYAQKQAELQQQAAQLAYENQLRQQAARSSGGSGGAPKAPTKTSAADSAKATMFNSIWSDPVNAYRQLTDPATANQLKYLGVYDELMTEYKAAATELRRTTNTSKPVAAKNPSAKSPYPKGGRYAE